MYYNKIVENLDEISNFINFYEGELIKARKCVSIYGNLEQNLSRLPGETELYFGQLQEIEAVLNYLNIQLRKIKQTHFKQYLEGYNRALSSREAEKFSEGEQEVIDYECIINEVALLRNKYLGIMKGLETKSFMIGHITRLRCAGMEDVSV